MAEVLAAVMRKKTVTGVYVVLNCDEFAMVIISSLECLLHASATMVKIVKLKTTGPFLTVGGITSFELE